MTSILNLIRKPKTDTNPEPDPMDRLKAATKELNEAWAEVSNTGSRVRPWIEFQDRTVMLTEWNGFPVTIYDPRHEEELTE